MQAASRTGEGMLAVLGLGERVLDDLVRSIRAAGPDVWVGVLNAPDQVVVSGTAAGLDRLQQLAEERGARRATRLDVAVAAHCPLMEPAAARLRAALSTIDFGHPTIPLAANTTARLLRTADHVRDELWRAVAAPVRWADTTAGIHERDIDVWVQMPPGEALARLAEPLGDQAVSVENLGLSAVLRRLARS